MRIEWRSGPSPETGDAWSVMLRPKMLKAHCAKCPAGHFGGADVAITLLTCSLVSLVFIGQLAFSLPRYRTCTP